MSKNWKVIPTDARMFYIYDDAGICVATAWGCGDGHPDIVEAFDNARLIAAAVNSYGKHCGARDVECAEGDLLGELVDACRLAIADLQAWHDAYSSAIDDYTSVHVIPALGAALAKLEASDEA